jgi:hypothetical protein
MVWKSQQTSCGVKQEAPQNEEAGKGLRRQPYESPGFAWEARLEEPDDEPLKRK